MKKSINKIRSTSYKLGSFLGDVQAVISLNPRKIFARFLRKKIFKTGGTIINRKVK